MLKGDYRLGYCMDYAFKNVQGEVRNCHQIIKNIFQLYVRHSAEYGIILPLSSGGGPKIKKAGRWMRKLVNLSLQITQFGFCCVYFVFMADNIGHVMNNHIYGSNEPGTGLSTRVRAVRRVQNSKLSYCFTRVPRVSLPIVFCCNFSFSSKRNKSSPMP